MIKKILLIALVVILAIGLWNTFAHGVSFGEFSTCSYTTLKSKAQKLVSLKSDLQKKNDVSFPEELRRLEVAKSSYKVNKQAYDDMAANASVEAIRAVNQRKEYLLDFLWMRIGTYANDNDVKVLIDPIYKESKINFDVSGQYIAVINFIYDLEKDSDLAFNVDNIVMQGGSSDSVTNARFEVSNINIVTSATKAE